MIQIKFKDEYFQSILNGSKIQTMRMPQSRIEVKEGDNVIGVFKNNPPVLLRIIKVGFKYFKSINDADAKREGFESADELKEVLKEIYNEYQILDSSRVYYYRFKYLGRGERYAPHNEGVYDSKECRKKKILKKALIRISKKELEI